MKQPTEAKVKKAVAQWLKTMGLRHWRMNSGMLPMAYNGKARFVHLCPPGTPDYLVLVPMVNRPTCTCGSTIAAKRLATCYYDGSRVTWLEVKRPLVVRGGTGGSEQSPEQRAFQREAERNGERYLLVRSVSDLVEGLK